MDKPTFRKKQRWVSGASRKKNDSISYTNCSNSQNNWCSHGMALEAVKGEPGWKKMVALTVCGVEISLIRHDHLDHHDNHEHHGHHDQARSGKIIGPGCRQDNSGHEAPPTFPPVPPLWSVVNGHQKILSSVWWREGGRGVKGRFLEVKKASNMESWVVVTCWRLDCRLEDDSLWGEPEVITFGSFEKGSNALYIWSCEKKGSYQSASWPRRQYLLEFSCF